MTRQENDHGAEALRCIRSPGRVVVVPEPPSHFVDDLGEALWKVPYFPTIHQWKRGSHRRICYQFDGRTRPSATNPPSSEVEAFLAFWVSEGYEAIRLGLPMSMTQSIRWLSVCDAFIGVDSGISHLAHSVQVPTFLLQYQHPLTQAHEGKKYIACEGLSDATAKVLGYIL